MKFEQAVKDMIKKYFDGLEPDEYKKTVGARKAKYNKDFFDTQAKDFGLVKDEEMDDAEKE